jgi:DnaJ-class molecular chaperone
MQTSEDDAVWVECPDCEGEGQVILNLRWEVNRWVDVYSWCPTCEGEGEINANK